MAILTCLFIEFCFFKSDNPKISFGVGYRASSLCEERPQKANISGASQVMSRRKVYALPPWLASAHRMDWRERRRAPPVAAVRRSEHAVPSTRTPPHTHQRHGQRNTKKLSN